MSGRSGPSSFVVPHDDGSNATEAAMLYLACRRRAGPAELRTCATAGHGFGILDRGRPIAVWPAQVAEWFASVGVLARSSPPSVGGPLGSSPGAFVVLWNASGLRIIGSVNYTCSIRDSGVIHQDFDGEVVVIDLASGNYFSLPGSGGVLWRCIASGAASPADLADLLVAMHDVGRDVAFADVTSFLDDLEKEGLVVRGPADLPLSRPEHLTMPAKSAYSPPTIDAFRELQDLFLLDPVHDVNPAAGWPHAAAADSASPAVLRRSRSDVVAAEVDGTVVAVNRDTGVSCRLDGEAARVWKRLESGPVGAQGDGVRLLLESGVVELVDGVAEVAGDVAVIGDGVTVDGALVEQIRPWGERRRLPRGPMTDVARALCDRLDGWFEDVAGDVIATRHTIGGHLVNVEAVAVGGAADLVAALPREATGGSPASTLQVRVWRGNPAGAPPAVANLAASLRANWNSLCGSRGEVVDLHTDRTTAIFDPGGNVLSVVDRERDRAWAIKVDEAPYPFWEVGAPFRFILHDHFARHGLQMVHGAAVGDAAGAVLVVGQGGSGKSSTALASAVDGLTYLGDDYCLVDPSALTVHLLYGTGKLVGAADHARLPAYRGQSVNADSFEHGGAGKGVYLVDRVVPGAVASARSVRAIVIPRIDVGLTTRRGVASRGDALAALLPSTVGQLPGADRADATRVARLVSKLPVYALLLGSDPRGVTDAIRGVLGECAGSA